METLKKNGNSMTPIVILVMAYLTGALVLYLGFLLIGRFVVKTKKPGKDDLNILACFSAFWIVILPLMLVIVVFEAIIKVPYALVDFLWD